MKSVYFPFEEMKATYDAALVSFSDSYRIHYCIRLYRATGEKKYFEEIKLYIEKNALTIFGKLKQLHNLDLDEIQLEEPVRGTILRNPIEYKRILRRQNYYKIHPELKFYFDSIAELYFLFDFKTLLGKYTTEFQSVIETYKKFPWQEKFITKEHLLVHPVLLTNCVYQLHEMGMIDSVEPFEQMVAAEFGPEKQQSEEKLFDQIYIYTHIIINISRFYQQFLNELEVKKYSWILDSFIINYEAYKDQLNIDLLIEILTCFFLCKVENPLENRILEQLFSYYDPKAGYLKKDGESTLQDMEHAHSIFLIYGLQPTKLFKAY